METNILEGSNIIDREGAFGSGSQEWSKTQRSNTIGKPNIIEGSYIIEGSNIIDKPNIIEGSNITDEPNIINNSNIIDDLI